METLSQMMLETPDLNQERLNKLKELFPDLFTSEGKLNEDELKKLTATDGAKETERYDFRWFGKSQAKRNAYTPTNTTLVFDEARSVNPNESENIIIEGENLEVIKLLLCAYREKVKCIYIDPPYNTGKDFVYSDNYTEEKRPYWEKTGTMIDGVKQTTNPDTSGRFHSDWLNMMYSRLLIARSLLRNDGVIFISIGDKEFYNLKKLSDEVFGDENFFAMLTRRAMHTVRNSSKDFNLNADYILVYGKNKSWFAEKKERYIRFELDKSEKYPHDDNDGNGKYKLDPLSARNYYTPYTYTFKNGVVWEAPAGSYPRYSPNTLEDKEKTGEIVFGKDGSEPKAKRYLKDVQEGQPPDVILHPEDVDFNSSGTTELKELFEGKGGIFSQPKPSKLIKYLLKILRDKESLIIDFFGGSGVTGQAVMELNEEDGGNRRFVLVQIPEITDEKSEAFKAGYKKISDITIERNKRVVEKIIAAKKAEHPNLFAENKDALKGLGFKTFQLVKSNFPRTEFKPDANKSDEENIEALKKYIVEKERQQTFGFNIEDLLTEILLKQGFMLNFKTAERPEFTNNRVIHATDGEKETLICLDEDIKLETIEYLKTHNEQKFICLERALDTTKKWNLNHYLGEKAIAF